MSNKEIDIFEIFQDVISLMNDIEKKLTNGENKKKFVIEVMREMIVSSYGEEIWKNKYEDVVSGFIDIVVVMSRADMLSDINRTIKRCCF